MPWEILCFVKNRFFSRFLSTNCHQILSPSLQQLSSYLCLSTKCIMPAQVPKTQELGRFGASFRRLRSEKLSASGGFYPLASLSPHQGLSPWTPLGALSPDPRYTLTLRARHGLAPSMGGFYHGLGGYAPHEPRQFECCHATKFTHTRLVCPYISVNTVVSGRVCELLATKIALAGVVLCACILHCVSKQLYNFLT